MTPTLFRSGLAFRGLLASGFLCWLSGCATPAVRVDPTVLHSSYDYVKPAEIANQSKPVWVLPVINKGWVPATVDTRTGDWISGHYTATIVQEGHWATQEEAELNGRPYVIAGDSKPVVPVPTPAGGTAAAQEVPSTGIVGGEMDLALLNRRLARLEERKDPQPSTRDAEETAAELRSLAQGLPASTEVMVPPTGPAAEGSESLRVATTAWSDAGSDTGSNSQPSTKGTTLLLPGSMVHGDYQVPSTALGGDSGHSEAMRVHYVDAHHVQIVYRGQTYAVEVPDPSDQIKITLPP